MQISVSPAKQASVLFTGENNSVDSNRQQTTAPSAISKISSSVPAVNPASHIDPALGIVVLEKYGNDGEIAEQYPTAHMMLQYKLYGLGSGTDN
ncbi:hypothetical protein [Acetobacter oeni]|uniref:Uncharacterized protein n=1 Tax=Acetobacter oeni TaxID=304077 RepID=A0A511XGE8_9PROT|nr:hypothetical protein [Acetobacter oeni]MBB3881802.1 hypothetical protein [Acetobacter oeni]NHO17396.1 hypothetical protein [Acetobacter oeni]GBR02079.1 hypothetical protein AA21952_0631 [Acetobacter oeni LMG 21952]GEN62024.1 hypothetical protein AOE01nite_02480 [Acetobacter oeni]